MKRLSCSVLLIVMAIAPLAVAQSPYSSLSFARETNKEGTTDYVLRPEVAEIQKHFGGVDKPYRIVGVLARPSKKAAVLLLANAQTNFQLDAQTDKSVVITVDSVEIRNLEYEIAAKNEGPPLKLEIGNVLIALDDLRKISGGRAVSMRMGSLTHVLDSDNLAAMRYLIAEIDKDEKKTN